MEDFSKIREQKNRSMSFEEYKSEVNKSIVKEGKFSKFMSLILFWPIHVIVAILGIDKEKLMSSSNSSVDIPHKSTNDTSTTTSNASTFREQQYFNPEQADIQRMQEEAYLQSAGFKREDLILTEEEYIQRKQEDAYFDSLPGYRKKDSERNDER